MSYTIYGVDPGSDGDCIVKYFLSDEELANLRSFAAENERELMSDKVDNVPSLAETLFAPRRANGGV